MSYLISLNPMLFKNIAHVWSFKHFVFLNLQDVQGVHKICARCVQDVFKMCERCAQNVCKVCKRCVRKMCARCVQNVCKMCARCVQDVVKMCSRYVQDVCKMCARCMTKTRSISTVEGSGATCTRIFFELFFQNR